MKTCNRCNKSKDDCEFYKKADNELYNPCKQCKSEYSKLRHQEKSKDFQWKLYRTEINKKYYNRKKNERQFTK